METDSFTQRGTTSSEETQDLQTKFNQVPCTLHAGQYVYRIRRHRGV